MGILVRFDLCKLLRHPRFLFVTVKRRSNQILKTCLLLLVSPYRGLILLISDHIFITVF
uniref:Uncharacterized protein n=1 Tax=Arundo donax TaxID=35708 RepID=A0A0A9DN33_ARUDO